MVRTELLKSLERLSGCRPIFHSEADFQFALSWQIQLAWPEYGIRLELPFDEGIRQSRLDIVVRDGQDRAGIELKYWKAPINVEIEGERFTLKDAVGHDINRYDAWKDVQRLERLIGDGVINRGFFIALTNHPAYWTFRKPANRVDDQFVLHEDAVHVQERSWAAHTGGTSKGREKPIVLEGEYKPTWKQYSSFEGQRYGEFRFLLLEISYGQNRPESVDLESKSHVEKAEASSHRRRRSDYVKLANYLGGLTGKIVTLSFAEIERIIGELPTSARSHREWWSNHEGNTQARWIDAGWRVDHVELGIETIVFEEMN